VIKVVSSPLRALLCDHYRSSVTYVGLSLANEILFSCVHSNCSLPGGDLHHKYYFHLLGLHIHPSLQDRGYVHFEVNVWTRYYSFLVVSCMHFFALSSAALCFKKIKY